MDWTKVGGGLLHRAQGLLWSAVGDDADTVVARLNGEPAFAQMVAGFMVKGGIEPTLSQQRAREIMGANFFGIEEATRHLGVKPRRFELAGFAEVPFADDELEAVKETHILAAVFQLSIIDLRNRANKGTFYPDTWYQKEPFAARTGQAGWRLVCKTAVPNSTNKSWGEQQGLLGKADETPTARVVTYVMAGHFLATGEKLFPDVWVRCSDVLSGGDRVRVLFYPDGVSVGNYSDDRRRGHIGLSSARKSD